MPSDISTYIRILADKSTWIDFCQIQESLKWFHEKPQDEIIVCYEAKFNYKLKCQDKFITYRQSTAKLGCKCQLIYSF